MITGFACKETEKIFRGEMSRKLPRDIQSPAGSKLVMLHAATRIEDLLLPPSNHLEKLKGDRRGQWSIRVNKQWRLCFHWNEQTNTASAVEIVDYH